MFITGPDVVKAVTGEEITHNGLGGADVHAATSGVAHFAYDDEESCLEDVRHLLSLLPSNNRELAPVEPSDDPADRLTEALLDLVPTEAGRAYDVRAVIEEIVDDGDCFEVHPAWAPNIVCALARLDGHVVGVVANQPSAMAGVLDIEASEKGARFVQFCDAFNIPLVTLVDVPGFLPGVDQEHDGIIRHGAKLLYAYCNATVPRISLVLRKAYGGAYIVMDSAARPAVRPAPAPPGRPGARRPVRCRPPPPGPLVPHAASVSRPPTADRPERPAAPDAHGRSARPPRPPGRNG